MITIEEFKKKQSETSRLIGLDLGSKRIGVSICDEKQSIATPFKTINKTNNDDLINELKKIIEENNQSVKDKVKLISEKIQIPIFLWDERLSTVGAFNLSSQLDVNVSKREKNIDQNAAAFILQGAIDYLNN